MLKGCGLVVDRLGERTQVFYSGVPDAPTHADRVALREPANAA